MPLTANDLPARSMVGHCPIDPLNETREKFLQIWSHKAANISNDLIEYTIRRMQSDRLRFLFQTRNEFTHRENVRPICQISIHTEDDLQRIKEHIRRFCLSTRNVYRHLRSDSRIYPKMAIHLDQGIMIKICRFIFKTKVLIKIHSKQQHLNEQQREQLNQDKIKQFHLNDPYRNIAKAFIVLQSNFEILFGDILDKDFFQNAKTAVQTLPIILDTSKTIRLIFCALYKLSEPERQAEAETIRQRRLALCVGGYGSRKAGFIAPNVPIKNKENKTVKTINEMLTTNQPQATLTSTATPTKTSSLSPVKTISNEKSRNQPKTKPKESSKRIQSSKSQLDTSTTKVSKPNKNRPSSSSTLKRKNDSSKKNSTKEQKKKKSSNVKNKNEKKSKSKNQNASTTYSTSSINNNQLKDTHFLDRTQTFTQDKIGWTTWLHNATLNLPTILPSKPLLTTWASLDRISKI